MESMKKTAFILLFTTCTAFFMQCSQEQASPLSPETTVQTDVVWKSQGIALNPTAVEFVRITVTSSCNKSPRIEEYPFSISSVAVTKVPTGCSFSILFEGLGFNNQILYKGEALDIPATGPVSSVSITAAACTPAPPDSLKATPAGSKIVLSWTDRANNEIGYIIKRAYGGDKDYVILDTATECRYVDTFDIRRRIPYYYLVYSYNTIGISTIADTIYGFSLGANTRPQFISTIIELDSTAEAGRLYVDTLKFSDADLGDSLFLFPLSPPQGFTIKDSIVTWIPDSSQSGSRHTVVAIVSDQDGARDSLIWSIKVTALQPPVFSVTELDLNAALTLGQVYIDTLKAIDPENQPLTFKLLTAPISASIDNNLGIIRWETDSLYKIGFSAVVYDNTNRSDTVSWNVTVSPGQ
jgi:hypothetical protein